MAEYLIFFNDEWVTEASDAGWRRRSEEAVRIFRTRDQIPTPDADRAAAAAGAQEV